MKKKLEDVDAHLIELEKGEFNLSKLQPEKLNEISMLYERIQRIQNRMDDQVEASRKNLQMSGLTGMKK